jgi:hypothetical protein
MTTSYLNLNLWSKSLLDTVIVINLIKNDSLCMCPRSLIIVFTEARHYIRENNLLLYFIIIHVCFDAHQV